MFLKKYIWLSAATLLTACDLIDYHPYDGRLDSDTSREINPTNIERIEKVCEGKDTIRFIFMGDTQRSYNETEDFVKYVNQLDSIDFIIHGGDYTEFGLKKEFEWNDDILSKLKVPYVGLIGNHDVIGNGDQVFRKIFGNETLPSLMFCLHAHNHCVSAADLFEDGIIYYGCANIAKRSYLLFTLTSDDYMYEVVNF